VFCSYLFCFYSLMIISVRNISTARIEAVINRASSVFKFHGRVYWCPWLWRHWGGLVALIWWVHTLGTDHCLQLGDAPGLLHLAYRELENMQGTGFRGTEGAWDSWNIWLRRWCEHCSVHATAAPPTPFGHKKGFGKSYFAFSLPRFNAQSSNRLIHNQN